MVRWMRSWRSWRGWGSNYRAVETLIRVQIHPTSGILPRLPVLCSLKSPFKAFKHSSFIHHCVAKNQKSSLLVLQKTFLWPLVTFLRALYHHSPGLHYLQIKLFHNMNHWIWLQPEICFRYVKINLFIDKLCLYITFLALDTLWLKSTGDGYSFKIREAIMCQ